MKLFLIAKRTDTQKTFQKNLLDHILRVRNAANDPITDCKDTRRVKLHQAGKGAFITLATGDYQRLLGKLVWHHSMATLSKNKDEPERENLSPLILEKIVGVKVNEM